MESSSSSSNSMTRAGPSPAEKVDQSEQLNTLFSCNEHVKICVVIAATSPCSRLITWRF